ncbi:MAG: hypothetical protein ACT4OJ_05200 [Bacteroidota bacterium]
MSLNNIELPASVVADLYKSSLVGEMSSKAADISPESTPAVVPSAGKETETGSKYLGNNRRNILIAVIYKDAVHIPDSELQFLTGILTACKLSLEDVAIVNLHNYPGTPYKELTGMLKSKIVLLFDAEPASFGLPMNFPHYQLQAFANNTFLYSPSLKQLENDKVEKSKLWVCLKRLFNL